MLETNKSYSHLWFATYFKICPYFVELKSSTWHVFTLESNRPKFRNSNRVIFMSTLHQFYADFSFWIVKFIRVFVYNGNASDFARIRHRSLWVLFTHFLLKIYTVILKICGAIGMRNWNTRSSFLFIHLILVIFDCFLYKIKNSLETLKFQTY